MAKKFEIIASKIMQEINDGVYTDKLPSEQKLAEVFSTTSITIRKALDILLEQRLIKKVPYVGNFIENNSKKVIHITWNENFFQEDINNSIQKTIKEKFAFVDIEFTAPKNDIQNFDLILLSGTTPLNYNKDLSPFPKSIISEFKSPRYFAPPFETHTIDDNIYALPILFSPALITINKKISSEVLGSIDCEKFDLKTLIKLGNFAREKDISLCDISTLKTILKSVIFSCGARSGNLNTINFNYLKKNIEEIWHIFSADIIKDNAKEYIINWVCRQNRNLYKIAEDNDFLSFPSLIDGKKALSVITGGFICCNSHSENHDIAFEIAKYFLSSEIQTLIAKSQVGFPILKYAMLDSLDLKNKWDNLSFQDSKNMLVNNAQEQKLNLSLIELTEEIIKNKLNKNEFLQIIKYEIDMAKKQENNNSNSSLSINI